MLRSFEEAIRDRVDKAFCVQYTEEGIYLVGSRKLKCRCGAEVNCDKWSAYKVCGPHIERRCPYCAAHLEYLTQITSQSKFKEVILKAFNYECALCGSSVDLCAHHSMQRQILPYWQYSPYNGVCLCRKCHTRVHHGKGKIAEDAGEITPGTDLMNMKREVEKYIYETHKTLFSQLVESLEEDETASVSEHDLHVFLHSLLPVFKKDALNLEHKFELDKLIVDKILSEAPPFLKDKFPEMNLGARVVASIEGLFDTEPFYEGIRLKTHSADNELGADLDTVVSQIIEMRRKK